MTLKEELREKIPEDILMTSEYKVLSSIIDKEDIKSIAQLKAYVESEMKKTDELLKKERKSQREGTMTRWLRRHTERLDFLRLIKQKVLCYL